MFKKSISNQFTIHPPHSMEHEWLLGQIDLVIEQANQILATCYSLCSASTSASIAVSSPNSDSLKGFLSLSGSMITKGDLTVKLKSGVKKLVVSKTRLWQLDIVKNCLVSASRESRNRLEALNNIIYFVCLARDAMMNIDQSRLFPNNSSLQPDEDSLILEFYIAGTSVITSICQIAFQSAGAIPLQIQSKLLAPFKGPMKIEYEFLSPKEPF